MCAWGVTAALYAREKTGKGQVVDTSLMGSVISALGLIMSAPAVLGQEFPREVRAEAGNPVYSHYQCKDDKWLAIAHLDPDRYWPNICRALEMEDLEKDSRFDSLKSRAKNAKELVAIMDQKFATRTREEWMERLKAEGCIFTPVQTPAEVANDPQAFANNYFVEVDHPEEGKTKMVGWPWDFSETPATCRRMAPKLGEHTDEIMRELGYTVEEISEMKEKGVIT
jgi:crotonobetainyl-CoA:carnitine CoA-transferase CaiB-like acyl-CoA transferase